MVSSALNLWLQPMSRLWWARAPVVSTGVNLWLRPGIIPKSISNRNVADPALLAGRAGRFNRVVVAQCFHLCCHM